MKQRFTPYRYNNIDDVTVAGQQRWSAPVSIIPGAARCWNPGRPFRNRLLSETDDTDLRLLAPHLENVRLKRGQVLMEVDETISYLWFPQSCIISMIVPMEDGSSAEVAAVGYEGMLGGLALFGNRLSCIRAVVLVPGDALRLPIHVGSTLIESSKSLHDRVIAGVASLHAMVVQSAACFALHPVRARLARFLLMFHDRMQEGSLNLTHDILAEALGVQRTTVTSAALSLMEKRLISYRRGCIGILDRSGLEDAACECYRANRIDNPSGRTGMAPADGPKPSELTIGGIPG